MALFKAEKLGKKSHGIVSLEKMIYVYKDSALSDESCLFHSWPLSGFMNDLNGWQRF